MSVFETLGIPSPDQCVGVVGLSISLVGMTIGVAALAYYEQSLPVFGIIVASLFIGWVSFLYCVIWGESH